MRIITNNFNIKMLKLILLLILCVPMLILYFVKSDRVMTKAGSNINNDILTNMQIQIGELKIKNGYLQKRLAEFKSNYFNILQQQNLNATIDLFEEEHELDPYGVAILMKIEQSLWLLRQTSSFEQPEQSDEQTEFKTTLLKLCKSTYINQQNLFDKEIQALRDDLQNQFANDTKEVLVQLARTANEAQESIRISQQNLFDKEIQALRGDLQNQLDSLRTQSTNNEKEVLVELVRSANKAQESLQQSINNSQSNLKNMRNEINKKLEEIQNLQLTKLNDLTMQMKKIEYPGVPKSCTEAVGNFSIAGIYKVLLPTDLRSVYCNKDGWLLIQQQLDGPLSFNRSWFDYRNGFGDPNGQYWMGLEMLREITMQKRHELLIVMTDFENIETFARYDEFLIGSEDEKYKLKKLGTYSGKDTNDRLKFQLNMNFTTFDSDNDLMKKVNCAVLHDSGWWYKKCYWINLNQNIWKNPTTDLGKVFHWEHQHPIKQVSTFIRMKL